MLRVPLLSVHNVWLYRYESLNYDILDLILGALEVQADLVEVILELQEVPLRAVLTRLAILNHGVVLGLVIILDVALHVPLVHTVIREVDEALLQRIHVR